MGQARYSYRFRLVPEVKKPSEELREAIGEREIQACIESILGVDSKRYASKPTTEEPNYGQTLASKLLSLLK